MKRLFSGMAAVLGLLMFTACAAPNAGGVSPSAAASPSAVQKVTAEEGKTLLDAGGITLVDVRTQAEYDAGHIPTAIVLPLDSIDANAATVLPDKNAPIMVYCRSGVRSAQAASKLEALGYTKIYDLGGIQSWPYATEVASGT